MTKSLRNPERARILIPVVEEVESAGDDERAALLASLKQAETDIARGLGDTINPQTLQAEFDAIFSADASDEDLDSLLLGRQTVA